MELWVEVSRVLVVIRKSNLTVVWSIEIHCCSVGECILPDGGSGALPSSLELNIIGDEFSIPLGDIFLNFALEVGAILIDEPAGTPGHPLKELALVILAIGEVDLAKAIGLFQEPLSIIHKALVHLLHRHLLLSFVVSDLVYLQGFSIKEMCTGTDLFDAVVDWLA